MAWQFSSAEARSRETAWCRTGGLACCSSWVRLIDGSLQPHGGRSPALAHGRHTVSVARHGTSFRSEACRASGRSGQPAQGARIPSSGPDRRNDGPAAVSEPSPGEYDGRPRAVRGLPHERGTIGRGTSAERARHATKRPSSRGRRSRRGVRASGRFRARARMARSGRRGQVAYRRRTVCGGRAGLGRPRFDPGRQAGIGSAASPDRMKARRANDRSRAARRFNRGCQRRRAEPCPRATREAGRRLRGQAHAARRQWRVAQHRP